MADIGPRIETYQAPVTIPALATCRPLFVPDDLAIKAAISDVLTYLAQSENWEGDNADGAACAIAEMLQRFYEGCMIGVIFPHARADVPHGCLPCDGSEYDKADYPALYDVLDSSLLLPGDKFKTPDLRGFFVLGSSPTYAPFSTGGAASVSLTAAQNGPHTHTTQPHTHSEVASTSTVINGGLEAPAPAATPVPTVTGAATVTVDESGAGDAHENMPPYVALQYCIVAM